GLDSGAAELTEVGTVLSVADGIARLHGLESCMSFEMLELPHDVTGLALNLESDNVGAVLFGDWERISEGDTVRRTGQLLEIPVGEALLEVLLQLSRRRPDHMDASGRRLRQPGMGVWQHSDLSRRFYPFSRHDRRTTILRAGARGACQSQDPRCPRRDRAP